jgi:hypothetical protein
LAAHGHRLVLQLLDFIRAECVVDDQKAVFRIELRAGGIQLLFGKVSGSGNVDHGDCWFNENASIPGISGLDNIPNQHIIVCNEYL